MKDQAGKLRDIVDKINNKNRSDYAYEDSDLLKDFAKPAKKSARVITVTSGKGGVGKTNITINLAIKLAQQGLKVIIIDADLGLSNIDIVFGIIPKYNLSDVINYRKGILDILEEGSNGVRFISGGSGLQDLVKIDKNQLAHLLIELGKLDEEADIILIDTGAGLSDQVLSFIYAAKEVIIVTTAEPTAITDAYALIKIIAKKDKSKEIKLLVNRAENSIEATNILNKLHDACLKFLGVSIRKLGYVSNDSNIPKAVKIQQPFVISFEKTEAANDISLIAAALIDNMDYKQDNGYGIRLFVNKLKWFFS